MGELDRDLGLMELLFIFKVGDRKIFYGTFPFERVGATFESLGISMTTITFVVEEPLGLMGFFRLLGTNLWYFLVGRHFGLLPFFFPSLVAVWCFVRYKSEWPLWQFRTELFC